MLVRPLGNGDASLVRRAPASPAEVVVSGAMRDGRATHSAALARRILARMASTATSVGDAEKPANENEPCGVGSSAAARSGPPATGAGKVGGHAKATSGDGTHSGATDSGADGRFAAEKQERTETEEDRRELHCNKRTLLKSATNRCCLAPPSPRSLHLPCFGAGHPSTSRQP
jgi:hypothetical protein